MELSTGDAGNYAASCVNHLLTRPLSASRRRSSCTQEQLFCWKAGKVGRSVYISRCSNLFFSCPSSLSSTHPSIGAFVPDILPDMAATPAYQTPTMPSQFPIRNPSASPASPHTRRSSDAMRGGSSEGMRSGSNAGPPHHMVGNTLFEDAATLKGDHSDSTLKGDHSGLDSPYAGYPADDGTSSHHIHKLERVTSTLQGPRKWMGLKPTAPLAGDEDHAAHAHLGWSKTKIVFKEPFAEFWGTFILVLFGKASLSSPCIL